MFFRMGICGILDKTAIYFGQKGSRVQMKKRLSILWILLLAALTLCGCSNDNHGLSKGNPTTISVWHYYNGHTASRFDELVTEFNNTVGRENGVIITAQSMSSLRMRFGIPLPKRLVLPKCQIFFNAIRTLPCH